MKTTGHLDWLSFTVSGIVDPAHAYAGQTDLAVHTGHGARGYRAVLRTPDGASIKTNGDTDGTTNIELTGAVLGMLRQANDESDRNLVLDILARGGRLSRLDAAVNIYDGGLTVGRCVRAWNNHKIKTRATEALYISKPGRSDKTFYIGSPASDRLCRIYDKKAEQKLDEGGSWLRIELQMRNERATKALKALAATPIRRVINRVIKDFVDMPGKNDLAAALADNDAHIDKIERKEPSTLRWLIDQVAPAMARYQLENPDQSTLAILEAAYRRELKIKGHGSSQNT